MTDDDFRALSDNDLTALAVRVGVPDRCLPLLQQLRDADVSAEATFKIALRESDKDYLRENDARESVRLKMGQAGMYYWRVESAWAKVAAAIDDRAKAVRPALKSFEVHLEVEVSRDAFLVALHKTSDPDSAAAAAIARGLPLDLAPGADAPSP